MQKDSRQQYAYVEDLIAHLRERTFYNNRRLRLRKLYPGKLIIVHGRRVAVATNDERVIRSYLDKHGTVPYVVLIPQKPKRKIEFDT